MLRLKNITKWYNHEQALKNINIEIKTGRLTVLIGPSGCGKSTLLKLIMGLEYADKGTIEWDDNEVKVDSLMEKRRQIGYVIQEGGLFPHLTAEKNITLLACFLGWQKDKISNRLKILSELVQLPVDLLSKYPLQLSGGQRQRVSLTRALMLDPEILLLDEPLGALDPMVRADLQKELKTIFQRLSRTVVLVTHDMGEAAYFADEIVLMREGEIIQQGSLSDLINRPKDRFVTRFIMAQKNPLNNIVGEI